MADPEQVLAQRVRDAIVASFGPEYGDADPLIRPSSFADFQANSALPLGKRLGRPPREVAAELTSRLDVAGICAEPEVSGPGFINLTLRDDWIAAQASQMLTDPRLGLPPVSARTPYDQLGDYVPWTSTGIVLVAAITGFQMVRRAGGGRVPWDGNPRRARSVSTVGASPGKSREGQH